MAKDMLLSFSIFSASGPLDFEAYRAATLQEGKYVWAWMPRPDHGDEGGRSEWEGDPHPGFICTPSSVLSNETFAWSQGLSPPRTEPAGEGATYSCVRKHPHPQPWPRLPQDPSSLLGSPGSPLLRVAQENFYVRLAQDSLYPGQPRSTSVQTGSVRPVCLDYAQASPGGYPNGTSGKEPACQCRRLKRHGLSPWVGKIPWRRAWQPTPVFLPGESHGQRSLACCDSRGCKESDMTERLN